MLVCASDEGSMESACVHRVSESRQTRTCCQVRPAKPRIASPAAEAIAFPARDRHPFQSMASQPVRIAQPRQAR